jgi:murein DD-endopeptidase MepM/ murein hydrolase activator NlpD
VPLAARLALLALALGCGGGARSNAYESATAEERARFEQLPIPLPSGTSTSVAQGAFGASSHRDLGHEYSWDFEVPFGTPILAAEAGVVIDVWTPPGGGGCDASFAHAAHNVKVRHADGTVAQYVHVTSAVENGATVTVGETIAHTAQNGWICYPHLHFGVYASDDELPSSARPRTIPILFAGPPDGLAREGERYVVP